jgi:hypothetical protein
MLNFFNLANNKKGDKQMQELVVFTQKITNDIVKDIGLKLLILARRRQTLIFLKWRRAMLEKT